jgi:GNAT superfamily N-acetyltransferase
VSALPAGYTLTGDPARIDPVAAHAYLTRSYWSPGIPLETVRRAIANSFTVAVLYEDAQVGMARLITDRATFAWLADVYVLEEHRGRGLSHAMLEWLLAHPELQGLRRWQLVTADAHELYRRHGWTPLSRPERAMERLDEIVYR